jgi:hypothetical protein
MAAPKVGWLPATADPAGYPETQGPHRLSTHAMLAASIFELNSGRLLHDGPEVDDVRWR